MLGSGAPNELVQMQEISFVTGQQDLLLENHLTGSIQKADDVETMVCLYYCQIDCGHIG